MGLVAAGVMGIKLQGSDEVVGAEVIPQPGDVFLAASDGSGKRVAQKQFPRQGRYGQGVTAWKLPGKVRVVGMTIGRGPKRVILYPSRLSPKAIRLDAAALLGRTARGRNILDLKSGERVIKMVAPQTRFFR